MPGTYIVPMLRRSIGASLRTTLRWNGGGGAFMCQRSTRKPRSSRSIAIGLVLNAYSSEPPSVFVCTKARCAKSLRLSTIRR